MLADAGDDVLQRAPLRRVIEYVVGGEERHVRGACHALPSAKPAQIIAATKHRDAQPHPARGGGGQLFQKNPGLQKR